MFGITKRRHDTPAVGNADNWQESPALAGNLNPTETNDIVTPWALRGVLFGPMWDRWPDEPKIRQPILIGPATLVGQGGGPRHQYGEPRESRATVNTITTSVRKEGYEFENRLTGAYGVIAGQLPYGDVTGPWDASRRTIRVAPPELWDQGTAIGSQLPRMATPGE